MRDWGLRRYRPCLPITFWLKRGIDWDWRWVLHMLKDIVLDLRAEHKGWER